jgi:hypothetical protein
MKVFNMRPSFHGYPSSSIVAWYYERAWNTLTGAKRAIVARAVDLYLQETEPEYRTIKFNVPQNLENGDQFLECNKKNIKSIDDFVADNSVRSKHFRDKMEIFVARSIDEIFESGVCEILKQNFSPKRLFLIRKIS